MVLLLINKIDTFLLQLKRRSIWIGRHAYGY
jgi:hypothetical protein